jgi:hypothetical protein
MKEINDILYLDGQIKIPGGTPGVDKALFSDADGLSSWQEVSCEKITDFDEAVDDRVSNLIIGGTDIEVVYDDNLNTLTINSIVGSGETFLSLTDTPASYSGQANKIVTVNSGENALQFSTTLLLGDGSASAPSYSFSSDTDTGFYRIGDNNIGLSLGGSLKVDFSTDIETTIPLKITYGDNTPLIINYSRSTSDTSARVSYAGTYVDILESGSISGMGAFSRSVYGNYTKTNDTGSGTTGQVLKRIYGYYSDIFSTSNVVQHNYGFYSNMDLTLNSGITGFYYGSYCKTSNCSNGNIYGFYFDGNSAYSNGTLVAGFISSINNYTANSSCFGVYSDIGPLSIGSSGNIWAGYFQCRSSHVNSYAVYGICSGSSTGVNYAIYGTAGGAPTNWAGYFDSGNVYIENRMLFGNNGSETEPIIATNADSNTGIYFVDADNIAISCGGVSVVQFSSTNDAPITISQNVSTASFINFIGAEDSGYVPPISTLTGSGSVVGPGSSAWQIYKMIKIQLNGIDVYYIPVYGAVGPI